MKLYIAHTSWKFQIEEVEIINHTNKTYRDKNGYLHHKKSSYQETFETYEEAFNHIVNHIDNQIYDYRRRIEVSEGTKQEFMNKFIK